VTGPGGAVAISDLYDSLTWKDERGIIPWLASSWAISSDAKEYTFTIAPNVTWHDGQPLTAEDVAFTFQYFGKTPYRWMSTAIVEQAEAQPGGPGGTVVLRLKQPFAPFLEDVCGVVPILPKHVWSRVADPATYDGSGASLGSGPFKLAEYRADQGAYRFLANTGYFRGAPRVGDLQHLNVPPETQMQATLQGQIDLVLALDYAAAKLFDDNPRYKVHLTPPQSIVRLVVNTNKAPLNRVEIRQALVLALDRAKIAEAVTGGEPIVGNDGIVPPGSPWFNPSVKGYPFDLARAKALLGGQQISVDLLTDPTSREPDLMAPMLAAAGITLNVKRADQKTRTELQRSGQFDLALTGHIGIAGDPDFLRRWYSGEETNAFALGTSFSDPEFDRLGKEQAATPDADKRRPLVYRMQEVMAEQLPTILLYHRRFVWAYDSSKLAPMATYGGLMNGIPFPHNKLVFLNR
jgi:peptide/nickel transport system substrate-binding protein